MLCASPFVCVVAWPDITIYKLILESLMYAPVACPGCGFLFSFALLVLVEHMLRRSGGVVRVGRTEAYKGAAQLLKRRQRGTS
jgi:hypothetical protein